MNIERRVVKLAPEYIGHDAPDSIDARLIEIARVAREAEEAGTLVPLSALDPREWQKSQCRMEAMMRDAIACVEAWWPETWERIKHMSPDRRQLEVLRKVLESLDK